MRPNNDRSDDVFYRPSFEKLAHEKWAELSKQIVCLKEHARNRYYVIHKPKEDNPITWRVICLTKAQVSIHKAIMESNSIQTDGRILLKIVDDIFNSRSIDSMVKKGIFRKTDKYLYPL